MARVRHQGPLKDTCLCNMHVHQGTKIIAYLNLIFQIIVALLLLASVLILLIGGSATSQRHGLPSTIAGLIWANIVPIIGLVIGIVVTILLLQGLKKRKPKLYWPFLVWVAIGIAVMIISLAFFIISAVLVLIGVMASSNNAIHTTFGTGFFITLILLIVGLAIHIYLGFIVVNRSRQLLEAELTGLPVTNRHNVPVGHNNPNVVGNTNRDNVTVVETRVHPTSPGYKPAVY